jgi:hypothetical protein
MRVDIKREDGSEKGHEFYHACRALNGRRSQPAAENGYPCVKQGWGNAIHRRKAFFTSFRFGEFETGRAAFFELRSNPRTMEMGARPGARRIR